MGIRHPRRIDSWETFFCRAIRKQNALSERDISAESQKVVLYHAIFMRLDIKEASTVLLVDGVNEGPVLFAFGLSCSVLHFAS